MVRPRQGGVPLESMRPIDERMSAGAKHAKKHVLARVKSDVSTNFLLSESEDSDRRHSCSCLQFHCVDYLLILTIAYSSVVENDC